MGGNVKNPLDLKLQKNHREQQTLQRVHALRGFWDLRKKTRYAKFALVGL